MNDIAHCVSIEASPAVPLDLQRCQFFFADGRRCRSPRGEAHPTLCVAHARSEAKAAQAANLAEELAPLSGSFNTASDVNHVLGNLFSLLAQNRIPRRNAVALGYLAQLLLQTLPAVREELTQCLGDEAWDDTLDSVYCEDESEEETEAETEDETQAQAEGQAEDQAEGQAKDDLKASIYDAAPTQIEPVPLPALIVAPPAHTEATHTEATHTETPHTETPCTETRAAEAEPPLAEIVPEPEREPEPQPPKFVLRQPENYNYWKELAQNEHLRKMRH